jgi:hypothetical protein
MMFAYGIMMIQSEIDSETEEDREYYRRELAKVPENIDPDELLDEEDVFEEGEECFDQPERPAE